MVLERFPDAIAAHMARLKLGQHGIDASVLTMAEVYGPPCGDARLMIHEMDRLAAAEVLKSNEELVVLQQPV
ncbi:MAG: hypothetical protein ACI9R3_000022 [Verrucomicrobiales bacterium]|jgi:hypothetical protein